MNNSSTLPSIPELLASLAKLAKENSTLREQIARQLITIGRLVAENTLIVSHIALLEQQCEQLKKTPKS